MATLFVAIALAAGCSPSAKPQGPTAAPSDPATIPSTVATIPTDPAPVPTDPAPVTTDPATVPTDSGNTVSGHVLTEAGQPVAGATVEFRSAGCSDCLPQPFTTTDATGAYSITLNDGVYGAACPIPFNCGPQGGDGGPFPVTVPFSGTLNFIVCSDTDYPQCLTS